MHESPWITIFGSRVRRFANNFHEWRSHEWKLLAKRITSDPKIVIHGNECIIIFLTRYISYVLEIADFAIVARDDLFYFSNCDVTTVVLWPIANAGYWHCDVIFVDCSCTRKLAQRRSSLVNNNREYRFLTTGIHGLACKKSGFFILFFICWVSLKYRHNATAFTCIFAL